MPKDASGLVDRRLIEAVVVNVVSHRASRYSITTLRSCRWEVLRRATALLFTVASPDPAEACAGVAIQHSDVRGWL